MASKLMKSAYRKSTRKCLRTRRASAVDSISFLKCYPQLRRFCVLEIKGAWQDFSSLEGVFFQICLQQPWLQPQQLPQPLQVLLQLLQLQVLPKQHLLQALLQPLQVLPQPLQVLLQLLQLQVLLQQHLLQLQALPQQHLIQPLQQPLLHHLTQGVPRRLGHSPSPTPGPRSQVVWPGPPLCPSLLPQPDRKCPLFFIITVKYGENFLVNKKVSRQRRPGEHTAFCCLPW